jgi:pilus assembly protein Flp/PilA
MKFLKKLRLNKAGATAIEYALIAGLVSVAGVAAMNGMSDQINSTFNATSSTMANN